MLRLQHLVDHQLHQMVMQLFGQSQLLDKFAHAPGDTVKFACALGFHFFEEYAAGRSARDIYTALNAEGFRTSRGNLFNKSSLRRILQNEKYVGVYQFADIRDEQGIPPIVDKELFEKAQKMLQLHHRSPALKKVEGGFLLTTKLFCGHCGSPMTGDSGTSSSGRVYFYYTCMGRRKHLCQKARVPKDWIEDAVVAALSQIVHQDEIIQAFADCFMEWQARQDSSSLLRSLKTRLRQVESAIQHTMQLIDSGFVTDSVKNHLIELEQERASLHTGIASEQLGAPKLERDAVVWFLERFRSGCQSDPGWRIFLVETFLQAAYLYDDGRLLLHLNFSSDCAN